MDIPPIDNVDDLRGLKGFKLIHFNCRSILNKINEIRFSYTGMDILVCSETWLNDQIPDHMVDIVGMDLFRWDRHNGIMNGIQKTRGGGVACYIKKDLQLDCHVIPNLCLTTCDIEVMTLRCRHTYGKVIHLMSVYRPPDGSVDIFFEILTGFIDNGLLNTKESWITGDYNIDFLKRSDIKTKKLFEFLRINSLKQFISVPTRLTGFNRSCIDLIVSNVVEALVIVTGSLTNAISDHLPVFVCTKKARQKSKFQKIKGRTYKNYAKKILQTLILNENWDLFYELENPIELWNFIIKTIELHIDVMCPIKFMKFRTNSPPWITQEIIESMNDRNDLYKQAKTYFIPANIRLAHQARNRTAKLIQSSKAEYIKETLFQYKDDPKKFWRVLNNNLLKGEINTSDITFNTGNDVYTTIADSCEYMNEHFADVGRRLYSQFRNDMSLNNYVPVYNNNCSEDDIIFVVDDIVKIVHDIDVHKGSGIDYLPSFILKDVFEIITLQLTYLFNHSMKEGIFPDIWAIATVTPIPKTGNKHIVNNWRPISIIPFIGKLMEKLCNSLYMRHLNMYDILCDEQYGFRPKRSTSTSIFNYLKNIIGEINIQKMVGAIYLDFSKAFDSINHKLLIHKLRDMGVPSKLLSWTESYLKNRKIKTKLKGTSNCLAEFEKLLKLHLKFF